MAVVLCSAGPSGQVAYVSNSEGDARVVCVVDVASSAVTRVGAAKHDGPPAWSPDGRQLAFETDGASGGRAIAIVRADGAGLRLVKHAASRNCQPRWSPDGARLAYVAGEGGNTRIAVYDLAAGTETPWGGEKPVGFAQPVWLAADTIVAVQFAPGENRMGSDLMRVTPTATIKLLPWTDAYIKWAPAAGYKGRSIAYE